MNAAFHNPVAVRFGRGAAAELPALFVRPVLLVTGRNTLARAGLAHLPGDGVHASEPVPANPSPACVEALAAHAASLGARTVVGLGGGSALDAAKSAAMLVGRGGTLAAFAARAAAGDPGARAVGLVQVPTTAGTGAEVTRWASLWDGGRKSSFDHASGYADVALVDPSLTDSMDARLTAFTGLDALAHAMESLWGRRANAFSDVHAVAALSLVRRHLLPCVRGAVDGAAASVHRDGMALAALHAGWALSNTATAAAHALSYDLTGRFGVPHGLAVGLLCRALLPVNARAAPERVASIVTALACADVGAVQAFIDEVLAAVGMRPSLAALGVPRAAHASVAATASGADRLANNPVALGSAELTAILDDLS